LIVDDNSIISYRENDDKIKSERSARIIKGSWRDTGNVVYISIRERLCAATPDSVISNRTPPPPSQKHHFTQKHQINFCIDDIYRADNQRRGADTVPNLIYFHYGTSNY